MSAPHAELTTDEYAEIINCERQIGALAERVRAIRRDAALRDGVAPEWLASH